MLKIVMKCSDCERLTIECKEKPSKPIIVRGHFRVINGKKVYVKTHYRQR